LIASEFEHYINKGNENLISDRSYINPLKNWGTYHTSNKILIKNTRGPSNLQSQSIVASGSRVSSTSPLNHMKPLEYSSMLPTTILMVYLEGWCFTCMKLRCQNHNKVNTQNVSTWSFSRAPYSSCMNIFLLLSFIIIFYFKEISNYENTFSNWVYVIM